MICPDCMEDYSEQEDGWRFVGIGAAFEGLYILTSDVYTSTILEEILNDAKVQKLTTISIDTYSAEYAPCAGCQHISLRERASRAELLDNPKYRHLHVYESF
jgi:hypothetical protein